MKNPNCDNDKCRTSDGEVRVLPTGGQSNAILCRACFDHELRFRRERNRKLAVWAMFSLPEWESLSVYRSEGPRCPTCGGPAEMIDKAPPGESGDVVRCDAGCDLA